MMHPLDQLGHLFQPTFQPETETVVTPRIQLSYTEETFRHMLNRYGTDTNATG